MANDKETKEIALEKPRFETKEFPENCRAGLANYQTIINSAVAQRNAYVEGVGMTLGLDREWQFDLNGFMNNQSCRFVRQVTEEKKD